MKGVFLDVSSLADQDLDLSGFTQVCDEWVTYPVTAADEVVERIRGAAVVISNKVVLGDAVLRAAAADLRLICVAATGYNNVAVDTARELGIVVSNVSGYGTDSVVQHVFALMLAHHTRLLDYTAAVRRGDWSRSTQFCLLDYPVRELSGQTLGIVGYGVLGRAVAAIAQAFGMRVLVAQRPGGPAEDGRLPLDVLLDQVDVLTLHVPLTDNTHHLIDTAALKRMKRNALLINTARGAVVDNVALAQALRAGDIGGAAIDVLDVEPPPADHPLLADDVPNLIVTPHSAWVGHRARQNVVDMTVANIRAYQAGEPSNRIV